MFSENYWKTNFLLLGTSALQNSLEKKWSGSFTTGYTYALKIRTVGGREKKKEKQPIAILFISPGFKTDENHTRDRSRDFPPFRRGRAEMCRELFAADYVLARPRAKLTFTRTIFSTFLSRRSCLCRVTYDGRFARLSLLHDEKLSLPARRRRRFVHPVSAPSRRAYFYHCLEK